MDKEEPTLITADRLRDVSREANSLHERLRLLNHLMRNTAMNGATCLEFDTRNMTVEDRKALSRKCLDAGLSVDDPDKRNLWIIRWR